MKRLLPRIALGLFFAQLLLMPVSWLLSAVYPSSGLRSLLSGEGLRWFMGHFTDLLSTPVLIWIVLCTMAWGCLWHSRLLHRPANYRESRALMIALLLLAVVVLLMLSLTLAPQAILLSAVGGLWPSPFSSSLVPVVAFTTIIVSATYGLISGRFRGVADVYNALLQGVRMGAPLLLFYVLLIQIYESLCYVWP